MELKEDEEKTYYYTHFLGSQSNETTSTMLDPISTIIRLGILSYYPIGTKIGIEDNKLIYSFPNTNILEMIINYQGFMRGQNNYSRKDILCIYPAVFRGMIWYNTSNDLKIIINITLNGLTNLMKNYNDKIKLGIEHTMDKINQFLKMDIPLDNFDKNIIQNNDKYKELFEKNQKLWSGKEIQIITEKLVDINEHYIKHETIDCSAMKKYLNLIEDILESKHIEYKKMLMYNDTLTNIN